MSGRYLHLPAMESFEEAALILLPGPAYGSDDIAAKNLAGWFAEGRIVESRVETVVDDDGHAHRVWVHYEAITHRQAAVYAVREALTRATVPHGHTRTCPHPGVVLDLGRQWYGIDFTPVEIVTATAQVMAEV